MELNTNEQLNTAVRLLENVNAPLFQATLEYEGEIPVIRRVVIIEAGESKNGRTYPARVIEQDGPEVFEAAKVYSTNHHKADKTIRNLVGYLKNVRFESNRLIGDLYGFSTEKQILQKAIEAHQVLGPSQIGLSIDTLGEFAPSASRSMREVSRLIRSEETSVDIVINPAARGRLSEANLEGSSMDEITNEIADVEETVENIGLSEVEVIETSISPITETVQPEVDIEALVEAKLNERLKAEENKRLLEGKLETVKDLGATIVQMLREQFSGSEFREADLDQQINSLRMEVGKNTINRPNVPNGVRMQITESFDKKKYALEGMLRGESVNGVKPYTSIRRALKDFSDLDLDRSTDLMEAMSYFGFKGVLGERLQETVSTSTFSDAWADALHRVLIHYANRPILNSWRVWTDTVSLPDDTNSYKFIAQGGYGELPEITSEGATYDYIDDNTERQVTLTLRHFGGLADITEKALRRDDIGVLQAIPRKLGMQWAEKVNEVVYELLTKSSGNGATMYDSKALYHTDHANIQDGGLSHSNYIAARKKMMKQTDFSNGNRLLLEPKFVLFATPDLDDVAYELFKSNVKNTANADSTLPNFLLQDGIIPVPVKYDVDTSTRCDLVASKESLGSAAVKVGFLNGNDAPEIYVSDDPRNGSRFSADKITYKIRGFVGASVVAHEGFVRIGNNS